jgi:hypothetical protein
MMHRLRALPRWFVVGSGVAVVILLVAVVAGAASRDSPGSANTAKSTSTTTEPIRPTTTTHRRVATTTALVSSTTTAAPAAAAPRTNPPATLPPAPVLTLPPSVPVVRLPPPEPFVPPTLSDVRSDGCAHTSGNTYVAKASFVLSGGSGWNIYEPDASRQGGRWVLTRSVFAADGSPPVVYFGSIQVDASHDPNQTKSLSLGPVAVNCH